MKLFTVTRPAKDSAFEVHLELVAALRAAAGTVLWYAMWVLLGILTHRAYVAWIGC